MTTIFPRFLEPSGTLNVHVFAQDESFADAVMDRLRRRLEARRLKVSGQLDDMERLLGFPRSLQTVVNSLATQETAQGSSAVHIWKPPAPASSAFREILWCQLVAGLCRLERGEWACLNVLCWPRPRQGHSEVSEEVLNQFHEVFAPFVETYYGDNLIAVRDEASAEDLLYTGVNAKVEELAPLLARIRNLEDWNASED